MPKKVDPPAASDKEYTGPNSKDEKLLKKWSRFISSANKLYENWEEDYQCQVLQEYWQGHQWKDDANPDQMRYTINLVYASLETRLPSLAFFRPRLNVTPRPNRTDDPMSFTDARMRLIQDTSNTLLSSPTMGFMQEIWMSIRDSHFRFGVIETGFSVDMVDNPNAGKPVLLDGSDQEMRTSEGEPVLEPQQIPQDENLWVRYIPAKQFRVSTSNKNKLQRNDWVGYYEWVHLEDIKGNKAYQNTNGLKAGGKLKKDYDPGGVLDPTGDDEKLAQGMIKIWKIWSIREKVRYIFPSSFDRVFQVQPYECLPLHILKYHEDVDSFYPVPPVWHWLGPQAELNETREMQRIHRKRFVRRYMVQEGTNDDELAKLESGEDGVYVKVPDITRPPIQAIQDAPLDRAVMANVQVAKEDFMQVSGISGEQRGVSEAETATQANIIDVNAKMRQSFDRQNIGEFIAQVAYSVMEHLIKYATMDLWVQVNVDPASPGAQQESMMLAQGWQQIKMADLGDKLNFQMTVDIESLTPVTEDQQRNQFNQVLQAIAEPGLQALLLASDALLRKLLYYYGMRSDREFQDVKQAMQTVFMGRMIEMMAQNGQVPAGAQGQGGPPPGAPGPQGAPPPPNAQIKGQMQKQSGRPQ